MFGNCLSTMYSREYTPRNPCRVCSETYTGVCIMGRMRFVRRNSGGSILELAVYSVYMSQMIFGPETPQIRGTCGQLTESGFDKDASVVLKYSGGRISTFISHFKVKLPNEAVVLGTKGNIKVMPRKRIVNGCLR